MESIEENEFDNIEQNFVTMKYVSVELIVSTWKIKCIKQDSYYL